MTTTKQTFYEELGGRKTLQQVHKIFYDKIYAHPWLKLFFDGFNQTIIEEKQSDFMGEKFGGPAYTGKDLKQVHENMFIPEKLVNIRHDLLSQSLTEAGIDDTLATRWLRIDKAFMNQVSKSSITEFYRDYHFKYKQRIIHPEPENDKKSL